MTDQPFPPTECWVFPRELPGGPEYDGGHFSAWDSFLHYESRPDTKNVRAYLVPPEMVEWQDISTAPRDGTPIDGWHGLWKCALPIKWTHDKEWSERTPWVSPEAGNSWPADAFTHWRPRPEGPK